MDGGKGNFAGTGGYTSGGTIAGNAGGYGNPSSATGGTGGQTGASVASGNIGGNFSGMGFANDAANRAAYNAMIGRVLNESTSGQQPGKVVTKNVKKTLPRTMPVVKIVKNPITGVLTPTPQRPPGWTDTQWANWNTHYYNSQAGIMQPPQTYSPAPIKDQSRLPSIPYSGGSVTGPGGMFGGPRTSGQIGNDLGNPIMGHNDAPIGLGGDWSSPDYGNPSGPGGVAGAIGGDYGGRRGFAFGGITEPGEEVIVGENGPERMMAPSGAVIQPFRIGSHNLARRYDTPMREHIGSKRMTEAQRLLKGLRKQRKRAA